MSHRWKFASNESTHFHCSTTTITEQMHWKSHRWVVSLIFSSHFGINATCQIRNFFTDANTHHWTCNGRHPPSTSHGIRYTTLMSHRWIIKTKIIRIFVHHTSSICEYLHQFFHRTNTELLRPVDDSNQHNFTVVSKKKAHWKFHRAWVIVESSIEQNLHRVSARISIATRQQFLRISFFEFLAAQHRIHRQSTVPIHRPNGAWNQQQTAAHQWQQDSKSDRMAFWAADESSRTNKGGIVQFSQRFNCAKIEASVLPQQNECACGHRLRVWVEPS